MRMKFEQSQLGTRSSKSGYLFAVMVLFVPANSFYIYYGFLFFGLVALVFSSKGRFPWRVDFFYLYAGSVVLFSLVCLYRWMYFYSYEDFKELLKLILFLSVVFFGVRVPLKDLERIFSLFVLVNCGVSLLQYLGIYEFGIREITNLYNAKHHVEASLSYSAPRALGLSPGPGQQSVICLFFFAFFLVQYFFSGGEWRRLLMCLLSALGMVLSQSKTALIAIAIGSVAVLLLFIAHASYKIKFSVLVFFTLVVVGVLMFREQLLILFPEYVRLAEQGGDVSSLQSRFVNWTQMLDVFFIEDSILFYLFGVGRSGLEYYGVNDLPYDSDYIYLIVNYGVVGYSLFFIAVSFFLIKGMLCFSRYHSCGRFLVIVLIYAIIAAFALNYFFEPRILMLFSIVIFNYVAYTAKSSVEALTK